MTHETLERIRELLFNELDEMLAKDDLYPADLDTMGKMVDIIKDIAKINNLCQTESEPVELMEMSESDDVSDFMKSTNGAPMDGVISILDAHMDCIRNLYPMEYAAIISKIDRLKA